MLQLAIFAEAAAALTGLGLLFLVIRQLPRERNLTALATAVLFFISCNAALIALALVQDWLAKLIALQVAGFLLLALLGACAWSAKPLMAEKNGRWMAIVVWAVLLGFGFIHLQPGLFQLLVNRENDWAIVLVPGGKCLLALVVIGGFLLLGKVELLAATAVERFGKRGAIVSATLLLLILAVITFSSVSLVYGQISLRFLIACQFSCALVFAVLMPALRHPAEMQSTGHAPVLRATQFLSTGVLIYGGLYLIILGLLVKTLMLLGGDWRQFVSFFAALSAIVVALALITGRSVRRRWTRFVERNLLAGSYDFRHELQNLTAAVSTATDRDELIQTVCRTLVDIFSSASCCLLVQDEGNSFFRALGLNTNGKLEADFAEVTLSKTQTAWLERVQQCFSVASLPELNEENGAGENLRPFLSKGGYELGAALFAGPNLLGVIFLGPKHNGKPYSEEDRQLLDLLGNAISISLHGSNLQQRMLEAKQMEAIYRLASFMTHDLRNAVSSLTLLTQNAKAHLEKKEFRADFILALSRLSEEMQSLVHKLAAVKTGGELQHYAECDPAELIYETLAELPVPKSVALEVDVAPLPAVVWDRGQIRVVLRNLLINALEAMPGGGTLAIRGSHDHALIKIAVSDTGVGMSRDFIKKRLFRPNQTTKAKGLGIGLHQSREIILAHGGNVQVKSQPGEGTTFEVILPCLHEKAALQKACNGTSTDGGPERLPFAMRLSSQINAQLSRRIFIGFLFATNFGYEHVRSDLRNAPNLAAWR